MIGQREEEKQTEKSIMLLFKIPLSILYFYSFLFGNCQWMKSLSRTKIFRIFEYFTECIHKHGASVRILASKCFRAVYPLVQVSTT